MLKKPNRLAKTSHVKKVFARGRGFFNSLLTVKHLRQADTSRFTVVVSTKVSKSAVKRNRIKRVLREYVRTRISSITPGDYAIIVKPAAGKAVTQDLVKSITEIFVNSRLIQK